MGFNKNHSEESKSKISKTMEGNKNASKWNEENVSELLEQIKEMANSKDNYLYLGSALADLDLYKQVWSYWSDTFKSNKSVFESIKAIEQKFESKLYEKALKSEVNASTAIFGLKNNHNWTDKQAVDVTTKGDKVERVFEVCGKIVEF